MYSCLSFKHIRYTYGDTDSIYISTCQNSLGDCLGYPDDMNHYQPSQVPDLYDKWSQFSRKFLVPDKPTMEQKRQPGLWKLEYKTDPNLKGEAVCLSPKCYWIGNSSKDYKSAQKGICYYAQTAGLDAFKLALYEDVIPSVDMASLRFNKSNTSMAVYKLQKPSLNIIYTKFYVKDRVICLPYED